VTLAPFLFVRGGPCAKLGKEPQKAYYGQMMFRVSPETYRKAALAAELAGKSQNAWAEEVLGKLRFVGLSVCIKLLL
jgi:hypothetical protein